MLAYACSYHPPAKGGARDDGSLAALGRNRPPAPATSWRGCKSYTERWHYLVLAWSSARRSWRLPCGCIAATASSCAAASAWLLAALRVAALVGLLAFYLHLEKRTERKVVHNSRVLVLVDTSLSMGLHDADGLGRAGHAQPARAGGRRCSTMAS